MKINRRTLAVGAAGLAGLALSAGLAQQPSAQAAPVAHPSVRTSARQYTRATLDLSGTWRLTSVFTSRLGVPIRPGSYGGNDVFMTLAKRTDVFAPPGNEPVYVGSVYDARTHTMIAGEMFVSPYVSPRGIVVTLWGAGNPDTGQFADAYEAVYTLQATNTTSTALHFTGSWIDQDHNAGTTTFVPAPGTILLPHG